MQVYLRAVGELDRRWSAALQFLPHDHKVEMSVYNSLLREISNRHTLSMAVLAEVHDMLLVGSDNLEMLVSFC